MPAELITPANRLVYEKKKSVEERCSRLRKAIEAGGGNTNVSNATGIPKPTLSTYSTGRDMKASAAVAIANACGVSTEWLLTGIGPMLSQDMKGENLFPNEADSSIEAKRRPEIRERAKRLKFAIQRAGGTNTIAIKSEISSATLERYMRGWELKASDLPPLADACGVSLDWLLRGKEAGKLYLHSFSEQSHNGKLRPVSDDMLTIPFFQTETEAGAGIITGQWNGAEEVTISKDSLGSLLGAIPKDLLFIRARGEMMQPTIQPRDIMIVDYGDHDLRPGIYIMAIGDMIFIKRLDIKSPGFFGIISDNKDYSSFEATIDSVSWEADPSTSSVRILGKVVGSIHLDK